MLARKPVVEERGHRDPGGNSDIEGLPSDASGPDKVQRHEGMLAQDRSSARHLAGPGVDNDDTDYGLLAQAVAWLLDTRKRLTLTEVEYL